MSHGQRIALVTGANRGLGLETCRQLREKGDRIVLTARDPERAAQAAGQLGAEHLQFDVEHLQFDVEHLQLDVEHLQLDVTDPASVGEAAKTVGDRHGRLDVLVNNAGVVLDGFDASVASRTLDVNFNGAVRVTDAFRPILSDHALIVMVSSGLGQLSCLSSQRRKAFEDPGLTRSRLEQLTQEFVRDVEEGVWKSRGWPKSAYSVSKASLNAFTRILAGELEGSGIRVNAVCPGWVRTDMGGPNATRDVATGGRSIVWAATLPGLTDHPAEGPSGGFFRDGRSISW